MRHNLNHRNATLVEVVTDSLEQLLVQGIYTCGERLIELTISDELNVSQSTVREALRILELEGWVVKRSRRGIYVREFSTEDVEELYTLRIELEGLVLDWAMTVMTDRDKTELAGLIGDARMFMGERDDLGLRETLFAFHKHLLTIANKPHTSQILHIIYNQMRLLGNLSTTHDPAPIETLAQRLTDYGKLITYIRYHDCDAAHAILRHILESECKNALMTLDLMV